MSSLYQTISCMSQARLNRVLQWYIRDLPDACADIHPLDQKWAIHFLSTTGCKSQFVRNSWAPLIAYDGAHHQMTSISYDCSGTWGIRASFFVVFFQVTKLYTCPLRLLPFLVVCKRNCFVVFLVHVVCQVYNIRSPFSKSQCRAPNFSYFMSSGAFAYVRTRIFVHAMQGKAEKNYLILNWRLKKESPRKFSTKCAHFFNQKKCSLQVIPRLPDMVRELDLTYIERLLKSCSALLAPNGSGVMTGKVMHLVRSLHMVRIPLSTRQQWFAKYSHTAQSRA